MSDYASGGVLPRICSTCWFANGGDADHCGKCRCAVLAAECELRPGAERRQRPQRQRGGDDGMSACTASIQWLDDSPPTPCVLPRGHDGSHRYQTALPAAAHPTRDDDTISTEETP